MTTYRDRFRPTEHDLDRHARAALYRHVFGTEEGQKVLDDILQRVLLMDALIRYDTPEQAMRALERKNAAIEIANIVLRPITDEPAKPKVTT